VYISWIMRIPSTATVSSAKLQEYLLLPREVDDKARFLARGGFAAANWQTLDAAIRELAAGTPAVQDGHNDYGTFWRTEGLLVGPQANLRVVLIWLEWALDGTFHFVTLKPLRRSR
jgi:hypothetical protein